MNYKLKKEYIGKPMGVSDVSILFEEEPNYGKSATIKYEITKHDKTIYDSQAVELIKKFDELEKKLDIAVKALEWYAQPDESLAQEALKQIKEVK